MRTELRVTLPGPMGSADARRALNVLDRLLTLLGQVEDANVPEDARHGERTVWGFTHVGTGSLTATLAPNRPRSGVTTGVLAAVTAATVEGLGLAEAAEELPHRWDRTAATTAMELARLLGLLPIEGLKLEMLAEGKVVREVFVTRRAEEHLRAVLKVPRVEAIGSAIGRLDSASLHERREAGLWLERTNDRVTVHFGPAQTEEIRSAWGRRVEIAGRLIRDVDGRLLAIRMRSLEVLPQPGTGPALTELVGLDPDLTGDLSPTDYLGMIRGAS